MAPPPSSDTSANRDPSVAVRVLVADDEPGVVRVLRRQLERSGFEVVEATDDSIRIKAEHKFDRRDFKVGKEPNPDRTKGDGVSAELTLKAQLTLKKT